MILCDRSLRKLCENGLLSPFNEVHLNPASIDICVGKAAFIEDLRYKEIRDHHSHTTKFLKSSMSYFRKVDLTHSSSENPYFIKPGHFLLVETLEYIKIDNKYVGEMMLKSSMARLGWEHTKAGHFDPGWRGVGTLEIKNITRYHTLPIWYNMRFAQLVIFELDQECENPYNGKYQNAKGLELAK